MEENKKKSLKEKIEANWFKVGYSNRDKEKDVKEFVRELKENWCKGSDEEVLKPCCAFCENIDKLSGFGEPKAIVFRDDEGMVSRI